MDAATREAVTSAAVQAARAVAYRGAGTIEFIADASEGLRPDRIWFMEMNTRLQVEHPVTEAVTGLDLVEWQLRIASGEPLPLSQDEIRLTGHAMEARLYAEDPGRGFLPSVGRLERLRLPSSVRVDSGVEEGDEVTPFYDPMIAKLIAHGPDRRSAAAALEDAAARVEVWPVRTNAAFLAACLRDGDFVSGAIDTGFIERKLDSLVTTASLTPPPGAVAAFAPPGRPGPGVWDFGVGVSGFRLNAPPVRIAAVLVDGVERQLEVGRHGHARFIRAGVGDDEDVIAFVGGAALRLSLPGRDAVAGDAAAGDGRVRSPMPGRIVKVAVAQGEAVAKGAALVVLEAMKMEHALVAPFDGVVAEVTVVEGAQVIEGVVLVRLEPAPAV
jgi:acetyl/propionyl-CoA carboxylase alpha subunit